MKPYSELGIDCVYYFLSLSEFTTQSAGPCFKYENFEVGVIFAFFDNAHLKNFPSIKIKPTWLYSGNESSIGKITSMWKVWPTFSQNFSPAKITTFTVFLFLTSIWLLLQFKKKFSVFDTYAGRNCNSYCIFSCYCCFVHAPGCYEGEIKTTILSIS